MRTKLRRRKKPPRCTSCEKPIPRSEPDVILEHYTAPGRLMFHEWCALDAYKALVSGKSYTWRITHRHINPKAN